MSDFPAIRPTLNLNFARSKQLDPRVTFRRASTGTYVDADGLIKTAGIDVPRFDHDPVTGVCKGLLVEESRTNLFTYSEQFNNAAWTKQASTINSNSTTAPDGTFTADTLIANSTNAYTYIFQANSYTQNIAYTVSFWAKYVNCRFVWLLGAETPDALAFFDILNGTVAVASGYECSVQAFPNGWFKCSAAKLKTGATGVEEIGLGLTRTTLSAFSNQPGDAVHIWGAQLEAGAFPTSYIPTAGATVTRSADLASMTGTNFSSWYNQSEGTVFVDYEVRNVSTVMSTAALENNASNAISTVDNSNNALILANGVSQYQQTTPAPLFGNRLRRAMGFATNNVNLSQNGVLYSRDSSVILPSINSFRIGTAVGANTVGAISRIAYWPKRLPDAQLQALTRP